MIKYGTLEWVDVMTTEATGICRATFNTIEFVLFRALWAFERIAEAQLLYFLKAGSIVWKASVKLFD